MRTERIVLEIYFETNFYLSFAKSNAKYFKAMEHFLRTDCINGMMNVPKMSPARDYLPVHLGFTEKMD